MATKKSIKRVSPGRVNQKGVLILLTILLGSISIPAILLTRVSSNRTGSLQVYEEIYAVSSNLDKEIGKIEGAIYEALYQGKVSEKNVLFSRVEAKHGSGYEWDFTELSIRVPNHETMAELYGVIKDALSEIGPPVDHKTKKLAQNEISCHVFVKGYYTHRIQLRCEGLREAPYENLPKIGVIIDDLGYDLNMAKSFIDLDLPVSFSVLPIAPYTKSIVRYAINKGYEVMLHLPMEPKNYPSLNPGPSPLLTSMSEEEIKRTLDYHLSQIQGVQGVNNHMGSRFTQEVDKISVVLKELKKRNLFYVDSRTTSQSVAFSLAKKMGLPVAQRSVFLDNDLSSRAISYQMERLLGIARHSGKAIGIGHPYEETLKVLSDYRDKMKREFEIVSIAKLVE